MPKNVMRLLDRSLGLMECKVCGRRHFAGLREGNHIVRDAWHCRNGCEDKSRTQPESERTPLHPV